MGEKTKIFGFHNSIDPYSDAIAIAIAETGDVVAEHYCSSEGFAQTDLGMGFGSTVKHDIYDEAFPEGWTAEFVECSDIASHEGLRAALALNREKWGPDSDV